MTCLIFTSLSDDTFETDIMDENRIDENDQNQAGSSSDDDEPELIVIDESVYSSAEDCEIEVKCGNFLEYRSNQGESIPSSETKAFEPELIVIDDDDDDDDDAEEQSTNNEAAGSSQSDKKNNDSDVASISEGIGEGLQFKVKVEKDSDDEICKNKVEQPKKNKDEFDLIVIDDEEESSTICDATLDESFKDSDVKNGTDNETTSLTKCQPNASVSFYTEDKRVSFAEEVIVSDTVFTVLDSTVSSTEDKAGSISENKSISSTKDQSASCTEDQSASPAEDQSTSLAEDQSASPTEDQSASLTEDKSESPTKNKSESPTEDKSESPTEEKSASLTENKSLSPTEGKSLSLTEDKSASPEDKSASPPEDKLVSPTEGKSPSLTEGKSASPTEGKSLSPTEDESTSSTKDEPTFTEEKSIPIFENKIMSLTKNEIVSSVKSKSAKSSKDQSASPTNDKSVCNIKDPSKSKPISTADQTSNIKYNGKSFNEDNGAFLIEEDTISVTESENVLLIKDKMSSLIKNIAVPYTVDEAVSLTMDNMLSAVDRNLSSRNNMVSFNEDSRESLSVNEAFFCQSVSEILPFSKNDDTLSFSKGKPVYSTKDLKALFSKDEPSKVEDKESSMTPNVQSIKNKPATDEKKDDNHGVDEFCSDTGNMTVEQEDLGNILECQLEIGTPNVEWAEKVRNWQKQLQQPVSFFSAGSRPEGIHKLPEGKTKLTKKGFFNIKVLLSSARKSFSFHHSNGSKLMKSLKSEDFLIDPVKWLIQKGLATGNTECPSCFYKDLRQVKTTVYADGYAWCCLNLQCKRYHPFTRPPFFNKYDYPLASLLAVVYHWCAQSHCDHLMEDTGLTIDSLMNLYQTLQLLCSVFTDNYDRNSKRSVKPYDVVETSVFQFGSSLILAVYERNSKLIRLQALPYDEDRFLVTLSKFAEIFIDRNHIVVSDCSLIEQLKIPCMGFAYANPNISKAEDDGWHCLNVISFVKRHVKGIFEKFEANSASSEVWQGFLNEVEWRQRYGAVHKMAFWSMLCCVAKKPARLCFIPGLNLDAAGNTIESLIQSSQNQDQKAGASGSCIQIKTIPQGIPKRTVNIMNLKIPEVENDLHKDNFSKKHNTSAEIEAVPTGSVWTTLKDSASTERSVLKSNFVESYGTSKNSSDSDVISSIMFQPDGLDSVTVTALLSIRTWPLVSYLQNLIKASKQPVDYNVLDWRTKLEDEGFFPHPLKWLVDKKFAPGNYSCNQCRSETVFYGDSEQHFLTCVNKLCFNVQPLKRPKFFSKFGFPMKDLLSLLFHWAAQCPFQTICKSVSLNEYKVRYVFWGVQKHCTAILQKNPKLGNESHAIEVGIIQYGEFCILGALNRQTKETRLRAMYAPILYKSTLFEPVLDEWLCKGSTILTCHNPFSLKNYTVKYVSAENEDTHLNTKTITLYLKSIVSALFSQYSTIGIKVDIIQSFLDEILWRQKYGCTPEIAFMSLLKQFSRDEELGYEHLIPQLASSAPSADISAQILSKSSLINDRISTPEGQKKCPAIPNVTFPKEKVQISNWSSYKEDSMDISNASSSLSFSINQIAVPETSVFPSAHNSTIPEKDKKTTNRRETSRKRTYSGLKTYSKAQKRSIIDCEVDDTNNLDEIRRNKIPKLNNKTETLVISALSTEQNASGGVLISKYSRAEFLKKAKNVDFPFKIYFHQQFPEAPEVRSNCLWSLGKIGGKLLRPILTDSLSFLENPRVKKSTKKDDEKPFAPLDEYYFAEIKSNIIPLSALNILPSVLYVYSCTYCKIYLFGNIEVIDHTLKHVADRREKMHPKIFSCPFFIHRYICSAYCLFAFSSESEQIHHLDDVHLGQDNSLSCLICSLPFRSSSELCKHMTDFHVPCEMPYTCPTCPYRSSLHKEVLEHFQLIHNNDPHLICPYCLKMCSPTRTDDPVLFTNAYTKHLFKHQEINENVQCPSCCLLFFTYDDLYAHAVKDHVSFLNSADAVSFKPRCRPSVVLAKTTQPVPAPTSHPAAVFANSKISELIQLKNTQICQTQKKMEEKIQVGKKSQSPSPPVLETEPPCVNLIPMNENDDDPPLEPIPTLQSELTQDINTNQESHDLKYHINCMLRCCECGDQVDTKHFFKLLNCHCKYSTFCAKAFVYHMMEKHFTREEAVHTLSLTPAKLFEKIFCSCLFSSDDPDELASHLKTCDGFINISNTDFTKSQKKHQGLSQMFKQLEASNQVQTTHIKENDTLNLAAIDNSSRNPSSPPLENLPMNFLNRPFIYTNEQMGNMPPPSSFRMPDFQNIPQYLNNFPTATRHTLTNPVTYPYLPERMNEAMGSRPNIQQYLVPQLPRNNSMIRETLNVSIPNHNTSTRFPPPAYGNNNPPYSIVPPNSSGRIKAGVMSVRNGVAYIQEVPIAMAGRYPPRVPFRGQSPSATLSPSRPNVLRCLLRANNWMVPKDVTTSAVITPRCSLQQQQTQLQIQQHQDHQQIQQQQQPSMLNQLTNLVTTIKQEKPD